MELHDVDGVEGKLKVWVRRVWTLEMVSLACKRVLLMKLTCLVERYWLAMRPCQGMLFETVPADEHDNFVVFNRRARALHEQTKVFSCSQYPEIAIFSSVVHDSVQKEPTR